jgi:hypothetical protein
MNAVPEPDGVKLTVHLEDDESTVPRLQAPGLPVAVLVVLRMKSTVPPGVVGIEEASMTVTMQVEVWLTATEVGRQETLVVVE